MKKTKFSSFLSAGRQVFLFLIFLIPLLDFFKPGLPLTHDGQDQVARIANFYQSLKEGNLIPRWAANLNWGYGHPILMFLYPLPSYLASFWQSLGFGLVTSTKIVFGLSFILSGIFMFLWIKEIWGREAGLAAALIYNFAPYRFVDLYVRGALGECWAFVWPPLICWFIYKFSRDFKRIYLLGASLTLAALILSHNALSLMFLPVIFGYMAYLVYQSKRKLLSVTCYLLLVIFGFALSFFFWFPALFEAKYTLREIVTKNQIVGFEPFWRLLWSKWNFGGTGSLSVQVGVLQWLMIILAPFLIWKIKKDRLFLAFVLVCFWLAIFLILPAARPLYLKISLLQKFQFAWRFLSLAIFSPAIFAGALIYFLPSKFKPIIMCTVLLASVLLTKNFWQAKDFFLKTESFYTQVYPGTTDTGESAPRWSVRFMENYPKAEVEVIDGKAEVKSVFRDTTNHVYRITAVKKTRLVENTLYFPNWQVLVDGRPVSVEFQDPSHRGLMTFWLEPGEHEVKVIFKETRLRFFANLVSLGGLISATALFCLFNIF